jgi:hypothetical protein
MGMNTKRLNEVMALIAQPDFQRWWAELLKHRAEQEDAQRRYDELLAEAALMEFRAESSQKNAIDTLYRAGECEDAAATMLAEGTELENRSFRAVSDFEEQRYKVSEIWYRLGATEKMAEERREAHGRHPNRKSEADLETSQRALQQAREDYDRETAVRNELWSKVEQIWTQSLEVNLLVSEQRLRGKRIRKQAEGLFALAEEQKRGGARLRAEAEAASARCEAAQAAVLHCVRQAGELFACTAGSDFLYFHQRDAQKTALCVSLIEDRESYNLEVTPLSVYLVDRQRGVAFLQPAAADAPSLEEADRRFEDYFLRGRGGINAPGGSPS